MLWLIISLLILSGTIALILGFSALQRKNEPMAIAFSVTMFSAGLWSFGLIVETLSTTLDDKIFWADIQFLGINILPLAWLMLIFYYTGRPRWVIRKLPILGLIPFVAMLGIWSNPYHHLFRVSPSLEIISQSFSVLNNDYGIFMYAFLAPYDTVFFTIVLVSLVQFWLESTEFYRPQGVILLVCLLLPLLVSSLYLLGITPIPYFNFTPIAFSFSGLLISWNIFSFRFLDIAPFAKDVVFKTIQVGIIVLDKEGRIIDLNSAAEEIVGRFSVHKVGIPIIKIFPIFKPLINLPSDEQTEIVLEENEGKEYYDTRISLVLDKKKHILGRVITLNNISERVKLYKQVKEASMRDSLTGVSNRRAFLERGENEIARTLRHKKHLSVIMIDIDNFKSINDKMGHQYGDKVLITIAGLCRQQTRVTDEIARYGGDEFVILLPETSAEDAFNLAERICSDVALTKYVTESGQICPIRISLGVTEFNGKGTLGSLLHQADQALYEAKDAGKSQVVLL